MSRLFCVVILLVVFLSAPLVVAQGGDVLVWSTGNIPPGSTPAVAAYLMGTGYFDSVVGIEEGQKGDSYLRSVLKQLEALLPVK